MTEPGGLARPIEHLRQVGSARAEEFWRLGVRTLGDLLDYFPRDYRLESEERPIGELEPDQFGVARGEVTAVNYFPGRTSPRFEATLATGDERLALTFFNGAYLRRKIHPGLTLRVRGVVQTFRNLPQMVNPKWEVVGEQTAVMAESRYRPIYPASDKLGSEVIEKIIRANLDDGIAHVSEWFDDSLLKRRGLMGRAAAYRGIHDPKNERAAADARRRLMFDELMLMQLALLLSRRLAPGRLSGPVLRIDRSLDKRIRARFPFELTEAQNEAVWQIVTDLKSGRPMKRLLQGDVGSGKTVVALYGMLSAVANKMQAAILTPTEVLAEQHYLTLCNWLAGSKVTIELFTGRTRRLAKRNLDARLAEGQIHIAVGTQALLGKGIEFANLGMVVVDEQHRLGVLQRAALSGKGTCPHYLVMTATPIPRTLALSYFADYDMTVIDALPPGRQPIATRWLGSEKSAEAYGLVRKQVAAGRQAYIVVPQVDDTAEDAKSVDQHLKALQGGVLAGLRLGALHGQMGTDQKQLTMTEFRAGRIDALVCTTVIEVGIDVPNATVIVIEAADRFGLSQLHQLRGRVGRGVHPSFCVLLSNARGAAAQTRLAALASTSSGFRIAEMDLKLRGPGEFFGIRQHGLPEFKLADVTGELDLLMPARDDAKELLDADPALAEPVHRALRGALIEQLGETLALAQVG